MNNQKKAKVFSALLFAAFTACGPGESNVLKSAYPIVQIDSTSKKSIADFRTPEEYVSDGQADCSVKNPRDEF